MLNHALRGNPLRYVIFESEFYNGGPGVEGDNSAFIMFTTMGVPSDPTYQLIKDCTFDTASGSWAFIKSYSTHTMVYEGNRFLNPLGNCEGLALKAYYQYVSVRDNYFDGGFTAGSICGNWNQGAYFDISFNRILNAATSGTSTTYGALTINHDASAGECYIHRNTFEGIVLLRGGQADDGPFHLYNNVIVNDMQAYDNPDESHINLWPYGDSDPSVLDLGVGSQANLVGGTIDGIIDSNGDLTPAYSSYLGTHGYQIDQTCGSCDNLILFDDFEYSVSRSLGTDCSNFFDIGGWDYVKAENCIQHASGKGYLYTTNSIPGYSGQFPGTSSSNVLALVGLPR